MRRENIPSLSSAAAAPRLKRRRSKQAGAPKVVMLEKAPEPEFGGNARYSHTGFRWVFSGADEVRRFLPDLDDAIFGKLHLPAYSAEQFAADLQRVTRGRINQELADMMVQQSNPPCTGCASSGLTGKSIAMLSSMAVIILSRAW